MAPGTGLIYVGYKSRIVRVIPNREAITKRGELAAWRLGTVLTVFVSFLSSALAVRPRETHLDRLPGTTVHQKGTRNFFKVRDVMISRRLKDLLLGHHSGEIDKSTGSAEKKVTRNDVIIVCASGRCYEVPLLSLSRKVLAEVDDLISVANYGYPNGHHSADFSQFPVMLHIDLHTRQEASTWHVKVPTGDDFLSDPTIAEALSMLAVERPGISVFDLSIHPSDHDAFSVLLQRTKGILKEGEEMQLQEVAPSLERVQALESLIERQ